MVKICNILCTRIDGEGFIIVQEKNDSSKSSPAVAEGSSGDHIIDLTDETTPVPSSAEMEGDGDGDSDGGNIKAIIVTPTASPTNVTRYTTLTLSR